MDERAKRGESTKRGERAKRDERRESTNNPYLFIGCHYTR